MPPDTPARVSSTGWLSGLMLTPGGHFWNYRSTTRRSWALQFGAAGEKIGQNNIADPPTAESGCRWALHLCAQISGSYLPLSWHLRTGGGGRLKGIPVFGASPTPGVHGQVDAQSCRLNLGRLLVASIVLCVLYLHQNRIRLLQKGSRQNVGTPVLRQGL